MKQIPLTHGKFALVDDADFERATTKTWVYQLNNRQEHAICFDEATPTGLHRFLLGETEERCIDHVDGNGLNNQRSNLRPATQSQNKANSVKYQSYSGRPCISRYKGVTFGGTRGKKPWLSQIRYQGHTINLGRFVDEVEAAMTYDLAAIELFGEFAKTNFPKAGYRLA